MKYNKEYFYIEMNHLKEGVIFPFQIFVFNQINNQHTLYLHANSPLEEKKKQLLQYIIDKGGVIAISRNQVKTFLNNQGLKEKDIPSLMQEAEHSLQKNQKMYKHLYEQRKNEGQFLFDKEFKNALADDNFQNIIDEARAEILTFEVTVNHTVSLAIYLTEILLNEDNYINRIVAISYFIAKQIDIKDQESLSDLVVAAFLSHIGLTQVERSVFNSSLNEQPKHTIHQYMKHPALSQHLLRKCGVKISDRCIKTIIEHHERTDGSGYPSNKMAPHIDILALIIGLISHVFEHTTGHINGSKRDFTAIVRNIKKKNVSAGLELEFSDKIVEVLYYLIMNK